MPQHHTVVPPVKQAISSHFVTKLPFGLPANIAILSRMDTSNLIIIGVGVAILGFLWTLHRDMSDLRERMARLEGLFEGFTRRESVPDQ